MAYLKVGVCDCVWQLQNSSNLNNVLFTGWSAAHVEWTIHYASTIKTTGSLSVSILIQKFNRKTEKKMLMKKNTTS